MACPNAVLRRTEDRVLAIIVLACLFGLASGSGASAQRYPPVPIGPILPAQTEAPHPSGQPVAPTDRPFGSDPVDAPDSSGVPGVIDTNGASTVPGTEVLGDAVANPEAIVSGPGVDGAGVIPLTGLDIVVLVAWGLLLILLGGIMMKVVRGRRRRRNLEHEQRRTRREARAEVPLADTHAFVGRYSRAESTRSI